MSRFSIRSSDQAKTVALLCGYSGMASAVAYFDDAMQPGARIWEHTEEVLLNLLGLEGGSDIVGRTAGDLSAAAAAEAAKNSDFARYPPESKNAQ